MMMTPEKAEGRGATGLLENNKLHAQNCCIPGTPLKSMEKVYKRRPKGGSRSSENQNSWIPGTPPKLIPRRQPENHQAVNMEEKACNVVSTSSGSSSACISSSSGLLNLNKSSAQLPVPDVATSGFKDSGDGDLRAALTDEQVTDGLSGQLNKLLVDLDAQLDKTPFTKLMNSFNGATPTTNETANSTPADCNLSKDSQIDRNIKEPDSGNFWSANRSLCSNQHNPTSTTENLQNGAEKCVSQAGHQNAQEDVASRMGGSNLNSQPEGVKSKRGPKPKPKKKKHRPRVVVDGKGKKPPLQPKTPKPVTPRRASSKEKKSSRKRKSDKENSVSENVTDDNLSKISKCAEEETSIVKSDAIIEFPAKTCRVALNFNLENQSTDEKSALTTVDPQPEPQAIECLSVSKQLECLSVSNKFECLSVSHQFGEISTFKGKNKRSKRRRRSLMIYKRTKKRSRRRRRLNTLSLLTLTLDTIKFPTKRNRLRRLPRKCTLSLLTAFPICNQLPKLPSKQAENEIICVPEASQNSSFFNDPELNRTESMALSLVDVEVQECPSKYEDFSLTTNLTGSQVLQEDPAKIDHIWKGSQDLQNFRLGVESRSICLYPEVLQDQRTSLLEVLPDQCIGCQEVLQIGSQEISQGQIINQIDPFTEYISPNQSSVYQDLSQWGWREIFLYSSQEILQRQRIDPIMQKNAWDKGIGSQEVFQEILQGQIIDPFMQKNTWEQSSGCFQEFLQRNDTAVQKIDEAFWLPLQSRGLEVPQEVINVPLNNGDIQTRKQDYGADGTLVPYQGPLMPNNGRHSRKRKMKQDSNTDGTLVLYQENFKPKKLSAKVYLDEVSLKMWEQLGNGDEEKVDEEKCRKEREIMGGRIESFITRMHMILGDRRFKPWKGSVVDSVVGVYLTQNVSDNLSSNAYMSLASKFPLGSTFDHTVSNGGSLENPDNQESSGSNNMPSIGRVYDSEGNMYYVTEPETDRTYPLTNSIRDLEVKDVVAAPTCDGTSTLQFIDEMQPSPALNSKSNSASHTFDGDESPAFNSKSDVATHTFDADGNDSPTLLSVDEIPFSPAFNSKSDVAIHTFDGSSTVQSTDEIHLSPDEVQFSPAFNSKSDGAVHTFDGSSIVQSTDEFQLSPPFNPSDVESTSKTCSMESSAPFTELSQLLESLTLHSSGDNIIYPEESQGDAYTSSTRMDHGNKASWERIDESKGDSESISLADSNDHFEHSISPSSMKETRSDLQQPHDPPSIGLADFNDHFEHSICHSNIEETRRGLQQPHDAPSKGQKGKGRKPKETKSGTKESTPRKKKKVEEPEPEDWELMRKMYSSGKPRSSDHMDSVDWEAVRCADVGDIAESIQDRGQQNIIAGRIKDFLNRLVQTHNYIDLEWLRYAPPDKVKKYLLEIPGLGLKSVECVRLLSLQHIAFPVDTNVGRIAVRLGWVPIQPLPEQMQIHLLEQYPVMDNIQKYLWPRLCHLDQRTLYELHYQLITFGKVFCTKKNPHCSACPMRGECKHFASAFASARLALPGPVEKGIVKSKLYNVFSENPQIIVNPIPTCLLHSDGLTSENQVNNCEPIIEEPPSPERHYIESLEPESNSDDFCIGDIEDIPTIRLQEKKFQENLQNFMEMNKIMFQDSKALVTLTAEATSIPVQKLKSINRLRTEHLVYVLPDNHELLEGFEKRLVDDPCPYLLAIWSPGETPNSIEPPQSRCNFEGDNLCDNQTCYKCNRIREEDADIVRGTILIPCLTANRGRFPLNGTYFQVNEVFADHETSEQPINVPRKMIANLTRQTAYFGSTASHISKALDIERIQRCFWRGFICVRGFDRRSRAPRHLLERFHCSPSKIVVKKAPGRR
ncbi:hypothetical protein Pint_31971 [Pistacia integerrima]|uniref:Uncharacterized protein n=1 Tax=Pistacia integerrima TaxID=434235 RepID=A0ACC0XNB1_9ROSI|nr:hypothetical protein Pint_31971 [Pistacia integerrima]